MKTLLYTDMKMLTIERENPIQLTNTPETIDLRNAAHVLCCLDYEQYKRARKDAMRELQLEKNEGGSVLVRSDVMSCAPVLCFINEF